MTSPTFTIANSYQGERELAHIDAWRLRAVDEEDIAAVLSSFGADAVVFIEWPEVVAAALPPALVRIELDHRSPEERLVRFRSSDSAISSAIARLIADTRPRHGGSEPELGDPRRR